MSLLDIGFFFYKLEFTQISNTELRHCVSWCWYGASIFRDIGWYDIYCRLPILDATCFCLKIGTDYVPRLLYFFEKNLSFIWFKTYCLFLKKPWHFNWKVLKYHGKIWKIVFSLLRKDKEYFLFKLFVLLIWKWWGWIFPSLPKILLS